MRLQSVLAEVVVVQQQKQAHHLESQMILMDIDYQ